MTSRRTHGFVVDATFAHAGYGRRHRGGAGRLRDRRQPLQRRRALLGRHRGPVQRLRSEEEVRSQMRRVQGQEVALRRQARHAHASLAAFADATREHGSLVQSFVRGSELRSLEHYPADDVIDRRHRSQFFYHCHRAGALEHGHLHLFRRVRDEPAHLLAIGLDARGLPVSMFTVNRWVTGGPWFDAARIVWMLERFRMGAVPDHAASCAWLTHFLRLYLPLAGQLLHARDARLAELARARSLDAVFADRRIEVLSRAQLNWARDLERIDAACAGA